MNMPRKSGKRRGSLTVEATLILPFVLISWLTIINLLNIYYMQTCIQQALNNTAQRLSEYCYLLYKTGYLEQASDILNMDAGTTTNSSQLKTSVKSMSEHAKKIGEELQQFSISSVPTIIDEAKGFTSSAKDAYNTVSNITVDQIKDYFLSELSNAGTGILVGAFVNSYIKDLKVDTRNIDKLDYSKSKFLYGDDQQFTIVVTYTYHNPLSIKYFSDIPMMQMVTMRPWIGQSNTGLKELAG